MKTNGILVKKIVKKREKLIFKHIIIAGPILPTPLKSHAMVQLGYGQVLFGGVSDYDVQTGASTNSFHSERNRIFFLTCFSRTCSISMLNQQISLPRSSFVTIPLPDTISGCITGGKYFRVNCKGKAIDNVIGTFTDCQLSNLVGDGFCHDETNNLHCAFDRGDCCGTTCINTDYCEDCICLTGYINNVNANALVGNGYCDDSTNNANCNFDGGDCCGSCVNKEYCKRCECFNETAIIGIPNALVGDGFCNDETNNAECMFDELDCCGYDNYYNGYVDDVNTEFCVECACKGMKSYQMILL